jgi:hypothetical protein
MPSRFPIKTTAALPHRLPFLSVCEKPFESIFETASKLGEGGFGDSTCR